MEIQFVTEALKEACLVRDPKGHALPREVLAAVRDLYAEMRNAEHLGELLLGQPGPDDLADSLEWHVPLEGAYQAVLRVNHAKPPMKDGGVDRSLVHRVQIMSIEVVPDA